MIAILNCFNLLSIFVCRGTGKSFQSPDYVFGEVKKPPCRVQEEGSWPRESWDIGTENKNEYNIGIYNSSGFGDISVYLHIDMSLSSYSLL